MDLLGVGSPIKPTPSDDDLRPSMDIDAKTTSKGPSVLTLEPFSSHVRPSRHSYQRKHKEKQIGQTTQHEILPGIFEPVQFRQFLMMRFDNKRIQDLDLFNVYKEIVLRCERKPKLTPQNDGGLLVEVSSLKDSETILSLSVLDGVETKSSPHVTLNQCKGFIFSTDLLKYSEDRLKEEFAEQGVVDVRRIRKRENGVEISSPLLILTFNLLRLPNSIQAAWLNLKVRPYVPRVRRCFYCQKFGHVRDKCRKAQKGQKPICKNCGEQEHGVCTKPSHCINCNGNHDAASNKCTQYIFEKEILTLKAKEHISYREARERVLSHQPSSTFAAAVKKNPVRKPNNLNTTVSRLDNQASNTNVTLANNVNHTKRRRSDDQIDQPKFKIHNTRIVTTNFVNYNPFDILQDEVQDSPSNESNEHVAVIDDPKSTGHIPAHSLEQLGNPPACLTDQAGVSVLSPSRAETVALAGSSEQAKMHSSSSLMDLEETSKSDSQDVEVNQDENFPRPLGNVEEELFISASSLTDGAKPTTPEKIKPPTSLSPKKEEIGMGKKNLTSSQPARIRKNSPTTRAINSNSSFNKSDNLFSSSPVIGGKIQINRGFSKTSKKDVSKPKK